MPTLAEPRLAPPGAGLPLPELLIARLRFALRRRRGNRASFQAHFARERDAIAALVGRFPPGTGSQRVLIARPRGLEDSSRHWSLWMTLDHLRLIHAGMVRVIGALAQGVVPPGRASTAAVKPSAEANEEALAAYETSCDAFITAVDAVPDLHTAARFRHPWFGPLDAAGWHALAGFHLGLHRVQIERILAGLGQPTHS